MYGTLYIAATPIGNLQDMNARTINTMKEADLILCEDTRTSQTLLHFYSIDTPVKSLHRHNEAAECDSIIKRLLSGENIILLSDAGTPLIRDPGKLLVSQAHSIGVRVSPLPGACAVTAALSCCGFDCDRFVFEGFLPSKHNERLKHLNKFSNEDRILVFFEVPHRLIDSLADIKRSLGEQCHICLAKELTKIYEAVVSGTTDKIVDWLNQDKKRIKGEFVIIVKPQKNETHLMTTTTDELLDALSEYLPPSTAAGIVAKLSKIPRRNLYRGKA